MNTIFDVSDFKPIYSLCLLGNIPIIGVSNWKRPVCGLYKAPRCLSQTKPPPTRWKNNPSQDQAGTHDESSSNQDLDQEVILNQSHVQQVIASMFMLYIEGPKMDRIVNNGLYHRFLKWRLKCENILQYELAMLAERRKCKKVIVCSGDFGYVSWNLTNDKLTLDIIWEKIERFCKPQSNEDRARFHLLTSFRQGERSVDE